jgi:hypothetical protein
MGNLVTNRVELTAVDGPVTEHHLGEITAVMSGLPAAEALDRIRSGDEGYGAWLPICLDALVPQPDLLGDSDLSHPGLADLALALASVSPDYVAMTAHQDRLDDLMPPEMARTRIAILERHGLRDLPPDMALEEAEKQHGGIAADCEILKSRVAATGFSDPVAWREEHWGTRAHASDGLFMITPEGGISVRFDTVNASPSTFIEALAIAFPTLQLRAQGFEEDTDYAFSAVSDGEPGEIVWIEDDSPEAVRAAREFVYPKFQDTPDEDMEP